MKIRRYHFTLAGLDVFLRERAEFDEECLPPQDAELVTITFENGPLEHNNLRIWLWYKHESFEDIPFPENLTNPPTVTLKRALDPEDQAAVIVLDNGKGVVKSETGKIDYQGVRDGKEKGTRRIAIGRTQGHGRSWRIVAR